MNTQVQTQVQAKTYQSNSQRRRHRKRLSLANVPAKDPEIQSPLLLKPLRVPAFLVSKRSKKGHVRSLVMFNQNAAVMLSRRSAGQPFTILTKIKESGRWKRHTEQLEGGPLHYSINAAQTFLLEHGAPWETGEFKPPSTRTLKLLKCLGLATPTVCSAQTASALIHAYHFARAFDAAFQDRPWVNGFDAREVNFKELQKSQ